MCTESKILPGCFSFVELKRRHCGNQFLFLTSGKNWMFHEQHCQITRVVCQFHGLPRDFR